MTIRDGVAEEETLNPAKPGCHTWICCCGAKGGPFGTEAQCEADLNGHLDGAHLNVASLQAEVAALRREATGLRTLLQQSEEALARARAETGSLQSQLDAARAKAAARQDALLAEAQAKLVEMTKRAEEKHSCIFSGEERAALERGHFKAMWRERLHAVEMILGSYRLDDVIEGILKGRTEVECDEVLAPSEGTKP